MNNQEQKREMNSSVTNGWNNLEALVTRLKKEDSRNLKTTRNFRWLLVIMAVFYTLLMVVNPDPELMMHHRITGLFYVTALASFAVVYRELYMDYRRVDYSLPSVAMLQEAAMRYRFYSWRYFRILSSLVLLDAGVSISYFHRLITIEPLVRILLVQAFFIPVMAVSVFVGYLIWKKKQKPIRDAALVLLGELQ